MSEANYLAMATYAGRPEPTDDNPEPHERARRLHHNGDGSFSAREDEAPLDVANEVRAEIATGAVVWITPVHGERKEGEPGWRIIVAEAR